MYISNQIPVKTPPGELLSGIYILGGKCKFLHRIKQQPKKRDLESECDNFHLLTAFLISNHYGYLS